MLFLDVYLWLLQIRNNLKPAKLVELMSEPDSPVVLLEDNSLNETVFEWIWNDIQDHKPRKAVHLDMNICMHNHRFIWSIYFRVA